MLPDDLAETLRRTEALAVQSALAVCLALELFERFNGDVPPAAEPGLNDLRDQVQRVGEALGTVLQLIHIDDAYGDGSSVARPAPTGPRVLN